MRFMIRIAIAAAMVLGGVALSTAPAQAGVVPPANCFLLHDGNKADCFLSYGDVHYVLDNKIDGWRVGIEIQTNYGKTRWCVDADGAGNGWTACNFDHREKTLVRTRIYEQNGPNGPTRNWSSWSGWVSTS